MNINLISPIDNAIRNQDDKINGHRYTVRFKEDIIIPKNSKIKLNFATLERQSEIQFTSDQQLFIHFPKNLNYLDDTGGPALFNNIMPTNTFQSPFTRNDANISSDLGGGNRYAFTLPKGFYTFERIYSFIAENVNAYLEFEDPTADPKVATSNDNSLYRSSEVLDTNPKIDLASQRQNGVGISGEAFLNVGILRDTGGITESRPFVDNKFLEDFIANPAHSLAANTVDVDGAPMAFCQTINTQIDGSTPAQSSKVYASYALGTQSYLHHQVDDFTPIAESNFMEVITNKTGLEFNTAQAGVAFGFWSNEVATGITGVDGVKDAINANDEPNRTRGTAATKVAGNNLHYAIPKQDRYLITESDGSPRNTASGNYRKIPVAFITCRISSEQDANGGGGGNLKLSIFRAASTRLGPAQAGRQNRPLGRFQDFTRCSDHTRAQLPASTGSMARLTTIRLDKRANFDEDTKLHFGIQTYVDGQANNFTGPQTDAPGAGCRTYFRVVDLSQANFGLSVKEQTNIILYDSKNQGIYFNTEMFVCANAGASGIDYTVGTDAVKAIKLKSQIPLSPILFSNTKDFGFEKCQYRSYPKGTVGGVNYDAKPLTIYRSYYLSATLEMANAFGLSTEYQNSKIQKTEAVKSNDPNTSIPSKKTQFSDITLGWRSKSYSIYLKGLPLNNYKNTGSKNNGGFSKQILANIPIPFKDSLEHFNVKTTALYQPDQPIITHLYNQDMVVNKFEVDIKGMTDDMDATEIEKSVINFTIIPPDDYTGNLNAVSGFIPLPPSVVPSG